MTTPDLAGEQDAPAVANATPAAAEPQVTDTPSAPPVADATPAAEQDAREADLESFRSLLTEVLKAPGDLIEDLIAAAAENADRRREYREQPPRPGLCKKGMTVAPNTNTNALNNLNFSNPEDDVSGNSFEAFLTSMIEVVARQAAADGKMNPAYAQLATQLAMARAQSMGGVQRSSFVSPAAGSTPVGRTESAPRGRLTESTAQQGAPAPAKPFDQMTTAELQAEHMGRLGILAAEGALQSPFYASTTA